MRPYVVLGGKNMMPEGGETAGEMYLAPTRGWVARTE
jgi:hypothetical protein